jgi:hypothetical protein
MNEKTKYKKGDKIKLINADKNYYNVSIKNQIETADFCTDEHVYLGNNLAWRLEDTELVESIKFTQDKKQFKLLNYEQY